MNTWLELIAASGFHDLTWQNGVMFCLAGLLIHLAVKNNYEPLLLIPMGFGTLLVNLPATLFIAAGHSPTEPGQAIPFLHFTHSLGIGAYLLPPMILLSAGILTDFRPLLSRPMTLLLGIAAQSGIMLAALSAFYLFGFQAKEAASIGLVAAADGPGAIFVTALLAPHLLGAAAVAAYLYMALTPLLHAPLLRLLTTSAERALPMPQAQPVSQTAVILFPVLMTLLTALAIPACTPLIGMLMFGNLLRESGIIDRLSKTAGGAFINTITLCAGLVIGLNLQGNAFLSLQTLLILLLGGLAFTCGAASGILLAQGINRLLPSGKRLNPCIGAAGVAAQPMAAQTVQQFVSVHTEGRLNLLAAAMAPNLAGLIGSALAAGMLLTLLR